MLMLFGFLFMILMFVFVGGMSGMISFFVDLPSAVIILAPLIFFLLISKSGSIVCGYIKASFTRDHSYTRSELQRISSAMKYTVKFILALGGCGFVAGLIGSLANIGAPERLGPNLAVSLLTLIYSIALCGFVFLPVEAWAENKLSGNLPDNPNKLP